MLFDTLVHISSCNICNCTSYDLCKSPLPLFLGWVDVTWDGTGSNSYRMGAEGKYDLALAPSHDVEKLQVYLAAVKNRSSSSTVQVKAKPPQPDAKTKVTPLMITCNFAMKCKACQCFLVQACLSSNVLH